MTPGTILTKADVLSDVPKAKAMAKIPYCKAIGSLMYATVATWPDISFTVSALSQFLKNPGCIHWEATKCIFHYLSGTKTSVLTYSGEHHNLTRYMDADSASQEHHKAISGQVFHIDGRVISWKSQKQELIMLSTTEAEYIATMHAT